MGIPRGVPVGLSAALEQIAQLVVATDVALKLYAKAVVPTSPASRLLKLKQAIASLIDELQRCPTETYIALASQLNAVVAICDCRQ